MRRFLIAGAAIFAALFLFSCFVLFRFSSNSRQSIDAFNSVAELVKNDQTVTVIPNLIFDDIAIETDTDTDIENKGSQFTAYEKYFAVFELNNDFVGWLSIDGTNINYPIMHTPNRKNYYLRRGFDRQSDRHGVPFIQENCTPDISDNIIIYGHHMSDGTMFADLCKYESEDFFHEHTIIRFDTLNGYGVYEIVAVFKTVAYSNMGFKYYDYVCFADETAFDSFFNECQSLALYDTGKTAEYSDRLLTLSTCEYSNTNGRLVVVAKKISNVEVIGNAYYQNT